MIALQLSALLLAAASPEAGASATVVPAAPPPVAGVASPPSPAAPPPPSAAAPMPPPVAPPRNIDDLSKPLLGAVPQGNYEQGVQGAFARAENLQGPLDGTWVLSEAGGDRLYRLQLDDPGYRGGPIQGAFTNLAAAGTLAGSGFLERVAREGSSLTLTFEVGGVEATAALEVRPGGTYAGKLTRAGVSRDVVLARP